MKKSEPKEKKERHRHVQIPVAAVEFYAGGNTIWVQGLYGTVLRLKCTGQIKTAKNCVNLSSHCDLNIDGDITFCLVKGGKR